MIIWLINIGEEIPSDPGTPRLLRTGILAERLTRRGHSVVWFNATVNHQRKEQRATVTVIRETEEGYKLVLLFGRLYARNITPGRIVSQIENARNFLSIAPSLSQPDVILCGYPTIELADAAVTYAEARGIPIAVDFRDMWPDVIAEQAKGFLKIAAHPMLAYWRWCLRRIVNRATAIVGVTDSFVDWALESGLRQRGPLDRSFHLAINPEPPCLDQVLAAEIFWDSVGIPDKSPLIIANFVGTLSRRLDIETLIRGTLLLSPIEKRGFRLVICGKGDLDEDLRKMAEGESCIIFGGWRTAAEVHVLLRRSHLGTIPYRSTSDFVRHYPNKVGEYLGAGLPIMTGLTGQVRTLLQERNIGYFYQEVDANSAVECLRSVLSDRPALLAKRTAALLAHAEFFDSTTIYKNFCDYLEVLSRGAVAAKPQITASEIGNAAQ
jgi:glycosyltransferase involved in cell wall biosynthesis